MKVLIAGLLKFPVGDAGSIRQQKLAIMLREMGHEVLVVGLGEANGMAREMYLGTAFVSLRQGGARFADKAASHLRFWKRLKRILKGFQPDAILMDDLGPVKTLQIKRWCIKQSIILIHDSVEWYSPEQYKHGRMSRRYLRKELLNRYLIDKSCHVIAISRFLYEHFKTRGCRCVNIPIVVTKDDLSAEKSLPEDKVAFTYAGQPGRKDYLHVMLEAFALLPEDTRKRAVFHIVGCTQTQMIASGISSELLQGLQPQMVIHGRVSHGEVLDILKETHFTLLMRSPEQRYAKAGFPTKVVESLSRSTPVICNLTSDLGLYLTDGQNALIVNECSAESLQTQLAKAIGMTPQNRARMCENALATAEKRFMYTNFRDELMEVLRADDKYDEA